MKKLTLIAVALLMVVVAAVTVLAGGEALSFSAADAPASKPIAQQQAQPQNYNSESYYFGPDFMCLIYGDTETIECFGSDAYSIVSAAPTERGFTRIDGGETYACAWNASDSFDYCWGSITRRPSTTLPTPEPTVGPTPEPTSIPEPTAVPTTVPPGPNPTPEPTSTPEPTPDLADCQISIGSGTLPITATGTWTVDADCEYPIEAPGGGSPRYFNFAQFEVTSSQGQWTATLESTVDTYLYLWEYTQAREYIAIAENDDGEGIGSNSRIAWTPVVGKTYVLDATTFNSNELGDFTLTITSSGGGSPQGTSIEQSEISVPLSTSR